MNQNTPNKLGTEKISRLLFQLALPAITAQIINMLYNIVDRIYIGHITEIGTLALTGVGVCLSLIHIFIGCQRLKDLHQPKWPMNQIKSSAGPQ